MKFSRETFPATPNHVQREGEFTFLAFQELFWSVWWRHCNCQVLINQCKWFILYKYIKILLYFTIFVWKQSAPLSVISSPRSCQNDKNMHISKSGYLDTEHSKHMQKLPKSWLVPWIMFTYFDTAWSKSNTPIIVNPRGRWECEIDRRISRWW